MAILFAAPGFASGPAAPGQTGAGAAALLTPAPGPEAAELLGMCPKSVYQLTRRRDFPSFKAGSRTVISAEGLREWVKAQPAAEKGGFAAL